MPEGKKKCLVGIGQETARNEGPTGQPPHSSHAPAEKNGCLVLELTFK
jgi:hypothetical protein